MYAVNVILLLSTACLCHALFKKKERRLERQESNDPEAEFNKFLRDACFESLSGAVMDGNTMYLLTPAQNAYDCLDQCAKYGQKRKPPVCCKAANFFPNKQAAWEQRAKHPFLKPGTCECFFSISYATFAKETAVWMKRSIDPKCVPAQEENCPKEKPMSVPAWPWPAKWPPKTAAISTAGPLTMRTVSNGSKVKKTPRPPRPPGPPGAPG